MAIIKKIWITVIGIFMLTAVVKNSYAANYYWVGGAGLWGNYAGVWSNTSGGAANYAQVPGSGDNVIFDSNSGLNTGATVTVNVNALCANFTVTGTAKPKFVNSGSGNVSISGSMVLLSGTTFGSVVNFKPLGNQTLTTNGVSLTNTVNIDGSGSLTLTDATTFSNSLNFVSGTFDTGNFQLNVGNLTSSSVSAKIIKLGSSVVNISGYAQFSGTNITMQAGTSQLHFTKAGMNVYSSNTEGLSSAIDLTFYDVSFDAANPTAAGLNVMSSGATGNLTFRNLSFNGNSAILAGSHNVQNLTLATAKSLTLPSTTTLTVNSGLNIGSAADACSGYSTLTSSANGSAANIVLGAAATPNVYHAIISDIKITWPSGAVTAQVKSYDKGGNTGWTFPAVGAGSVYYWSGGAGNWSDITHWKIDDGAGGRMAAGCLPGITDDIVFDNLSGFTAAGQIVSLNVSATCRNISFNGTSNAPTLSGSNAIVISGSAIWQSGMILGVAVDYSTNGAQTITSNGVIHAGSYVYFNGKVKNSDIIKLNDAFNTTATLTQNGGNFNTNGNAVTMFSFVSNGTIPRRLELNNSLVTITGSNGSAGFDTSNSSMEVATNTSTIQFTANTFYAAFSAATGQTYNDLTFVGPNLSAVLNGGTYNTVTFLSRGTINASITVNTLNFSPGKTYSFAGGPTHTINTAFNADGGSCSTPITINTSGSYYNLKFAATAIVNVNWANISGARVSRVSGSSPIIANNSIDVGNNTGWVFPVNTSRDLYWVGGAGNWSDLTHWSLSSGGTGNQCPPGVSDNVFFDAGSGFTNASKTIVLDAANAYVHNFTGSGAAFAPIFTGNPLTLYGSMILQAGTVYTISNTGAVPASGTIETLTTNGTTIGGSFSIYAGDNAGGIKLVGSTIISGDIGFGQGIFDTNGASITAGRISDYGSTSSSTSTLRTLKLGSSTVTITSVNQAFILTTPGTKLEAGTSEIILSNTGNSFMALLNGLVLNKVTFSNTGAGIGRILNGYSDTNGSTNTNNDNVTFNQLIFKGNGYINTKGNVFGTLLLSAGFTYQFKAGGEQIINDHFYAAGNSCKTMVIKSTSSGNQAKLNVKAGNTNYNYMSATDINATGNTFNLDINSSNGGNNTNIVYTTTGTPGTLLGLGDDRLCTFIDPAIPASTIISADGFNGDIFTTYSWTKISGTGAGSTVLSTTTTLDITTLGYGTYRVNVDYGGCPVYDDILIQQGSFPPTAAANQSVCYLGPTTTTFSKIAITGTAVKWYRDAALTVPVTNPATTQLTNGSYYATQTVNNSCESKAIRINIVIDNCNMANPNLRQRIDN